ncbi:dead end protein 1 [Epinephelus lanceolatus]|uniref:dead end protein 1 n=1 Tax=Epinephelus lanceolatus TaxID=310571 RepID=UPI0014489C89|nr:dead end protein 1 [Epinephelus lanceolatus]
MEDKQSQVLNIERVKALEAWLKATNIKLTQVNGQRKYGGPPEVWDGPTPGARCEVFISQIPRDTYEDQLIPLFSSVGPLWEFRLMMNFSGQNRGFAYGKYGSPAVATEAIRVLHGHVLEPGLSLSVRRSTEKRHLCIGDLPASTRQEDLLQALRVLTEGVERVSLKAGPGIQGVSAIIAFSSHYAASMAKKMLVEAFRKQFALDISIEWKTTVKPIHEDPLSSNKPLKSPLPTPLQPPRHTLNSRQPSAPPPRQACPSSAPQGFCKAVGGPTTPQQPPDSTSSTSSSSHQGHLASTAYSLSSPVMLLRRLCEATGFGQPLYELQPYHAGPDGFLYFTYKVHIPGRTSAFKGVVMILPGNGANNILDDAQRAAAQQILQKVYNNQLAH